HHAIAIRTTKRGRTINVAVTIQRHGCRRILAIVPTHEAVDRFLSPRIARQLLYIDSAIPIGATQAGGSIKIACRIKDHAANRLSSILADAKPVNLNFPTLRGRDFKVGAEVSSSLGSSEQIAVGAQSQSTESRSDSIRSSLKAVQRSVFPGEEAGRKPVDTSAAIYPSRIRRAVKIPFVIEDWPSKRSRP